MKSELVLVALVKIKKYFLSQLVIKQLLLLLLSINNNRISNYY